MAGNDYHVLFQKPYPSHKALPRALEAMARRMVQSGRLRVNADNMRNFVTYSTAATERSFSVRELTDAALLEKTKAHIARSVPQGLGPVAVNERLDMLLVQAKKARGVPEEIELRVARLLVQAAHKAVIRTLLAEGAEIFVSYSHTVGDLMAVHFWQSHGSAGGMQASSDNGSAVYVSCGGDPFFDGPEDHKMYTTDGFQALARMLVIAGQELGHFADLMRSNASGIIGRHSAHFSPLRATEACKTARDADIANVAALQHFLQHAAITRLLRAENAVAFYNKRSQFSPQWCGAQIWRCVCWLRAKAVPAPVRYARTLPRLPYAMFYARMLADMAFNLAPDADAYKRPDAREEEAIACIEALARVPQQVVKWGHDATQTCWPQLYAFYYGRVIPALPQ
jgi:hypothetical protein